jgi:hypothetical protein
MQTATTTAAAAVAATVTTQSAEIHRRRGISKVTIGGLRQDMENRKAVSL